jgi:raffinose/stachyose/melibiose transport system permease protein
LIGLIFPYEATVIPLYYVFRDVGLTDSLWALILPQIGLSVPFGTFWMRAFFRSTPGALVEASRLDGASSFATLWRVLLPQAWPAITTMVVLVFMWTWNEFLLALVMIQSDSLRTAPLGLALFAGTNRYSDPTLTAAAAVLVALPIVVVYVFLQRSFIRGMFAGSVKE